MITQPYPYHVLREKTHYIFESVGEKGSIYKVVIFTLFEDNIWNLGFGDLKDGLVDDSVMTNNHDAHKVIRTVARIAMDFLVRNSGSVIEIKPLDEKRKSLYNGIFHKYFKEIEPIFKVLGTFEGKEESYTPLKSYEKFRITFKF